jgi:sterol desaturase/sphingolipid hydroxylase (fatty acid hydroxylase superfamily)
VTLQIGLVCVVAIAAAILAEMWWTRNRRPSLYDASDTEVSLVLLAGWIVASQLEHLVTPAPYRLFYDHSLVRMPRGIPAGVVLILLGDLLYYWSHRLSHRIGWLWASHYPHHSSTRLNFLASLRQGWTDLLSGTWLFWIVLSLAGIDPSIWNAYFLALVVWQLWIHNEWIGKLGPLEWIVVTPSHHRVHHAIDAYENSNFGGLFIVWDRMFGTFRDEGLDRVTNFGVMEPSEGDAVSIALAVWRTMARRIWPSWRRR